MAPMCSLLLLLPLLPHSTAALSKSKPPARYRYHTLRATPLSLDPIARSDAAQPLFTAAGETSVLELEQHDTGNASTVRLLLAQRHGGPAPGASPGARRRARRGSVGGREERDARRRVRGARGVRPGAGQRRVLRAGGRGNGGGARAPGAGHRQRRGVAAVRAVPPVLRAVGQGVRPAAVPLVRRRLDAGAGGCDRRRGTCLYQVAYGDGSVTAGELATETLSFAQGARVPLAS